MSISPSAFGPISMPAMRNTATSGIPIFRARRPVIVPTARIRPQASRMCFAISTAGASNWSLRQVTWITQAKAGNDDATVQSSRPQRAADASREGGVRTVLPFSLPLSRESGTWNGRSADLRRGAQVLGEERERAAPGEIGGGLVVAGATGVVVGG